MKLLLISSILLFVALASAEPTPYVKVLYEDGYAVSESNDPREITLRHEKSLLVTYFYSKTTRTSDRMILKRDLLQESGGFVIEAYPPGSGFEWGDCRRNSSEQLKPLIEHCEGNLMIRLLTNEERDKVRAYKDDQKASRKPFEVLYDHERVTTKSTAVHHFTFGDYFTDYYFHDAKCIVRFKEEDEFLTEVGFKHRMFYDSFVIEGLPSESNEKCGTEGLDGRDLQLQYCSGKIKIKKHN